MRQVWMVLLLAFFTFSGFLMAFGDERGKREEYQKQTEARLRTLKQKFEVLKARSVELKDEEKKQFDEDLEKAKEKEKAATVRLQRLRATTAKAWDRGKAEVEESIQDLDRQYEKLETRFKNR